MKSVNALTQECLTLRDRYDEEPVHSNHVAAMALQIFDGLQGWHRYGDRVRELLFAGAVLHDIGWSQTPEGRGHHKESARLIRTFPWKNLKVDEVLIVSQIARYHRRVPPQADHEEFQSLPAPMQKQVMILGGILRISDALDRQHIGRIDRVESTFTQNSILVRVQANGPWEEERTIFNAKRDMLQLEALRPVLVDEMKS